MEKFQGYRQSAIAHCNYVDVLSIWVLIRDSRISHVQRYFIPIIGNTLQNRTMTIWWFYCGYHWKWYCCYIRILAVIIPPEDVALDKQSVDNGKEVLTSRLKYLHIAISLPGVHWKYLQQLHGILRGYLSLLFNKYPQILKFLTLKLISPMVNNSTIQMVMII